MNNKNDFNIEGETDYRRKVKSKAQLERMIPTNRINLLKKNENNKTIIDRIALEDWIIKKAKERSGGITGKILYREMIKDIGIAEKHRKLIIKAFEKELLPELDDKIDQEKKELEKKRLEIRRAIILAILEQARQEAEEEEEEGEARDMEEY